jgi:hypothetical protein
MVIIGVLAVLAAVLLLVFVLRLSRSPQTKVQLGTDTFEVGRVDQIAPRVAEGGPLLFQALRGAALDIYVQHLGTDTAHGWLAFEAHRPGALRRCVAVWQPPQRAFVDSCDHVTYPADGTGLEHYAVTVAGGKLAVDLRQSTGTAARPT